MARVVFLLEVMCPDGHKNGGAAVEWAGFGGPPDAWLEEQHRLMSRAYRAQVQAEAKWGKCKKCGLTFAGGHRWKVGSRALHGYTLAEAKARLITAEAAYIGEHHPPETIPRA